MVRQLIFGSAVSLGNIAIHALVMVIILGARRIVHAHVPSKPTFRLTWIMIAVVAMLMAAHLCEVAVWSIAYAIVDAAPQGTDLLDFAFVNHTTLGYGDIVPTENWRPLGPMTAMNGIMLFGWSTAVIFNVLWTTISSDDFRRTYH